MRFSTIDSYKQLFTEYTELRVQENKTISISLVNGDVVRNSRTAVGGVSARVFKNGLWGFSSDPVVNDDSIKKVIDAATANALFMSGKTGRPGAQLPITTAASNKSFATKKTPLSQKELIDFLKAIDAYLVQKYPLLGSRTVSLNCIDMEKSLITSHGTNAYSLTPRSYIGIQLTTKAGADVVDLGRGYGGRGQFEDVYTTPDALFADIDKQYEQLMHKAEGIYPEAGFHDVIFDADLAGILAHEAIGHTVESDGVLGGSIAADYLNKQIASELVTLVDFANTALGQTCPVPVFVDDEGTEAKDAVLIDKGILRSYMHNKETAQHFNVAPMGNARAFGFFDEPLIRMRNTAIMPGQSKLEDMIASIENGYYFMRPSNGQADSTSEFMFGVCLGYEIKNGKLGKGLRDTTISGVAFDMLKTVTMVSDEMKWSGSGMCGKKQWIPVGMGGPAIKCKINVGGR